MKTIVQLNDVSFKYNQDDDVVLKDISLTINEGEWVSLVGQNGSGKSTLARLLDGLLLATTGDISVMGLSINEDNIWTIRDNIGMVFQNPDNQFVGATVEDDVAFSLENNGISYDEMHQRVQQALAEVDMTGFETREPNQLSGGQKQRVALAGIIAQRPKLIILDEATSMLDPEGRQEVIQTIKMMRQQYPVTIISITHDITEVMETDRVITLQQGEIISDMAIHDWVMANQGVEQSGLPLPLSENLRRQLMPYIDLPCHYLTEKQLEDVLCQLKLNN